MSVGGFNVGNPVGKFVVCTTPKDVVGSKDGNPDGKFVNVVGFNVGNLVGNVVGFIVGNPVGKFDNGEDIGDKVFEGLVVGGLGIKVGTVVFGDGVLKPEFAASSSVTCPLMLLLVVDVDLAPHRPTRKQAPVMRLKLAINRKRATTIIHLMRRALILFCGVGDA